MYGNDRSSMRRVFVEAWRKRQRGMPMQPLDLLIADVIALHPEYHALLEDPDGVLDKDYTAEGGQTNPFLHLGMHVSLREQLGTDRPRGIAALYQQLSRRAADPHQAEHWLMECLGQILWEAQRCSRMPDEQAYLECARRLLRR